MSNSIVGHGPSTVRKFILNDGGHFTLPPNATILYSEVVADSDGTELLEIWLAVVQGSPDTTMYSAEKARTIHTSTVVHGDPPVDEAEFRRAVEEGVNQRFNEFAADDDYDDDDYDPEDFDD